MNAATAMSPTYTADSFDTTEDLRELAESFASDYHDYINGEQSLDRRKVNHVLATLATELLEPVRYFDGKITTTRYNERVIRTLPWERNPSTIGSYGIEIDEVAYESAELPADEFVETLANWLLSTAKTIAAEEAQDQEKLEADPHYEELAETYCN